MDDSLVRVIDNRTVKERPIFTYESELKQFQNDLSMDVELRETSGWAPEENEIR